MNRRHRTTALVIPATATTLANRDEIMSLIKRSDFRQAAGHAGYRAMVEWGRGKCFPNYRALEAAFAASQAST